MVTVYLLLVQGYDFPSLEIEILSTECIWFQSSGFQKDNSEKWKYVRYALFMWRNEKNCSCVCLLEKSEVMDADATQVG